MVRTALAVALSIAAAHDPSCSTDSTAGGVNAPCTRPSDCGQGLVCAGGVCGVSDAGASADASLDAAGDAAGDATADAGDQ